MIKPSTGSHIKIFPPLHRQEASIRLLELHRHMLLSGFFLRLAHTQAEVFLSKQITNI